MNVTDLPASYWRRAFALVIDAAITLGAATYVYAMGFQPRSLLATADGFLLFIPLNWLAIGALYSTLLHGSGRGQTLGKMITGIRVSDASTGESISRARAFGRWLVTAILWSFPLVPLIGGVVDAVWCLFDARRQTIHDKVAHSVVCRSEPARMPRLGGLVGDDAVGRAVTVRSATAAGLVGLIFLVAAEGLDPASRVLLFAGVALACLDAVNGRSLRAPDRGDRRPLLARVLKQLDDDVLHTFGRTDVVGRADLGARLLTAAADGRLAVYALFAGVLALYGSSALLTAERVESVRLVLVLLALSFLAPLPASLSSAAAHLRQRAGAVATVACFGSIVTLALSAFLASLPMFIAGLIFAAIAARTTRHAIPRQPFAQSTT